MINFEALRKARERMEDSRDGQFGRCGNWKIALGGYDTGYEVYYKDQSVMRVNYELDEYEFYSCDYSDVMFTQDTIPQIKKALEITPGFDNVGDIDDVGDYIDHFGQYVNGVEANVSESGRSNKMKFKKNVKESIGSLESFLAKKEKEFKPSGVNPSWDVSEDKAWAVQEYLSSMGEFTDEDKEFLKKTDPELLSLSDEDEGEVVKEAKLPVMWAIDYRDFHTAIHGLIYGKNRRDVEKFYDRLKVIYADDDISPDEQEMCYQDLWDEFYPRIKQIDEINFRDIGKLPSGKYGIIIDDVEYRLVNNVAIDLYEESAKRCSKMKFKKIVKESDAKSKPDFKSLDKAMWDAGRTSNGKRQNESDEGDSDHPRIYVGTYSKYNDGSIDGKWIDLSQFDTYEEFVDYCRELHNDEDDPEFMVQDFENFPRKWYHEGGLPDEDEFNKINDYYLMDDSEKRAYEAYVNYTDNDDIDDFHEAYQGQFDSASDFAYDLVDNLGWEGIGQSNIDMYFDYDAFGRDLMFDFHMGDEDNEDADGNPEDPDHYYDNEGYDMGEYESDYQVAMDQIDGLGGVDQLGSDTTRNYFDYEAFGRDLLMSDYFEEDGYVFRRL